MFINSVICFFLGYIAYPYFNHIPFPAAPAVEEQKQEPTPEDLRRLEYVKECQRYGFSKSNCESLWDGIPL